MLNIFGYCSSLINITIPKSVTSIGRYLLYQCHNITSIAVESGNAVYDSRKDCNAIIESATNTLIIGCSNSIIPNSVTSIGENSFSNCTGLTSITIPNSVTSIGRYAFVDCWGLASVTMSNSVTSIGEHAFDYCKALTSITIPGSVTFIGERVFDGCTGLRSVISEIEDPFDISTDVFYSYNPLNFILYVPKGTKAKYEATAGWNQLMIEEMGPVELKDGDTFTAQTIEGATLTYEVLSASEKTVRVHQGANVNKVTIPETVDGFTVVSIGTEAFENCTNLTEVDIPSTVTEIKGDAFGKCGFASFVLPKTVTSIGGSILHGCSNLTSVSVESGNTVYDSRENCNGIIETATNTLVLGYERTVIPTSVTAIGEDAFHFSTAIDYEIPSHIVTIGDYAFYKCKLTSVLIPASVTSIGEGAFDGCQSLTTVISIITNPFPIDNNAFYYAFSIATLYVPYGTKALYEATAGWNKFANIVEMEEEDLTYKDGDTFEEAGMTYQVISASEKTVKLKRGSSEDSNVSIPSVVNGFTVTAIGKAAFRELNNITTVTIPNSVVLMERSVFDDCANLTSVSIPSSVTSIGERLFTGCKQLTSVTVAGDNPVYDSRNNCNAIIETATNTLVVGCIASVIPDGVVKIGAKAFEDIRGLVSISIPEGVARIEEMAFIDCSNLEEITLPSSLTYIAEDAFSECPSITKVTCLITNPFTINKWTFGVEDSNYTNNFNPVVYNTATLYVPFGTKSLYEATDYWKEFSDIMEIETENEIEPTDISTLTDAIYANAASGSKGGSATLTISLKNAQATNAYSFDLVLPNGVTVDSYTLSSRHNGHSHSMNYNETTGAYSFAVLSIQSREVTGNDGTVLTLKLSVADNVSLGDYAVKIQNAKYSLTSGASSVALPDVTSLLTVENYIKGDANGDGMVDIADAVCIVNHIVGKATPAYLAAAADANGDGVVDIADAVRIVNLIVGKITTLAPKLEFTLLEPQ